MFSEAAEKQTATVTLIIYFLTTQKKQVMSTPNKSSMGLQNPQRRNNLFNFKNAWQGGLIGVFLLFALSSTFTGGKKDGNQGVQQASKSNFLKSTQSNSDILALSYDNEDLKVRKVKLAFGEALRDVYKNNPNLLQVIINDANSSPQKYADIRRICNAHPDIKTQLANSLNITQQSQGSADEIVNNYLSQLEYKGVQYTGLIQIYNINTMDVSQLPIISGGLDVDESSGLDDGILAYSFTTPESFEEVIIDENNARETNKPLLIFGNGNSDEEFLNPKEIQPMIIDDSNRDQYINGEVSMEDRDLLKASSSTKKFDYLHILLKGSGFHYDGCCKNNITLKSYYWIGANQSVNWGWLYRANAWKQIHGLTSGQCNNIQHTQWGEIWYPGNYSPTAHSSLSFYFVPYERDWYSPNKSLGNVTYQGKTIHIQIDPTYIHERYSQNMGNWGTGWPTEGVLFVNANALNMWQYVDLHSSRMKLAFTRTK